MKKVKKILLILATIFSVFALIAMFLPYFFDLNHYKPKIQALVSEKLNAKVDFTSARLNLFGGLGVTLSDVSLENTSQPFAGEKIFSAKTVDVLFKIIPIFSHKLIGTVYLNKPVVNIVKIGNQDNLSDIMKPSSPPPASAKNQSTASETTTPDSNDTSSDYTLILDEFSVNDANVIFKDLTQKSSPTIIDVKDINIDMSREGQVFNIEKLTMALFSGKLVSHMKIDLTDPQIAYSGDCDLTNLSLADMYHSFNAQKKDSPLEGAANLKFTFNGRGTTKDVYSKALNANGTFKIKTGELKVDTTMPVILDQLGKFLTGLTIPGLDLGISKEDVKKAGSSQEQHISLNNFGGDFVIKKGMLYLKNDIKMTQGLLKLDIIIGVFTSSLSGTATFIASEAYTKTLISINKNFSLLLDKDGLFHLKIYLSGTVSNPNITIDTQDVMSNILIHATKSILNPIQTVPNIIKKVIPF